MGNTITFAGIKCTPKFWHFIVSKLKWIYNRAKNKTEWYPRQHYPSDLWSWVTLSGGNHPEWQLSQYINGLSAKAKRFLPWTNINALQRTELLPELNLKIRGGRQAQEGSQDLIWSRSSLKIYWARPQVGQPLKTSRLRLTKFHNFDQMFTILTRFLPSLWGDRLGVGGHGRGSYKDSGGNQSQSSLVLQGWIFWVESSTCLGRAGGERWRRGQWRRRQREQGRMKRSSRGKNSLDIDCPCLTLFGRLISAVLMSHESWIKVSYSSFIETFLSIWWHWTLTNWDKYEELEWRWI